MRLWLVAGRIVLVVLAITLTGCTFSSGDGDDGAPVGGDAPPQVVTATLSEALRTPADPVPGTEPMLSPESTVALLPSPTLAPTATTAPAAATNAVTMESAPRVTPNDDSNIVATVTQIAVATATTEPMTPTQTITPSPVPTTTPIPTLAPTRTLTGPTTVPPLDDGSGNLILGTGDETALNPLGSLDELPETLYYLSDVGGQVQVFRLRVGLNHPDQLTYSGAGVRAYSVAPDGTLAYVDGGGNMLIGGIPVALPASVSGTGAQITALAWSPGGDWLAYTVGGADSGGGVWMRNRAGTTEVQVAANAAGEGGDARIYSGPIDWQPNGETFIVRTQLGPGDNAPTPYTQFAIRDSAAIPLWDAGQLPPDTYTRARWNVNGNSVIVSGGSRVLRIEPEPFTVTELLGADVGLSVGYANQWVDGTLVFAGADADGAVRLYRLAPGTQTPVPFTDALTDGGRLEFLWDDVGQGMLVAVYDTVDAPVGTGFYRTEDGTMQPIGPLTGPVGAPQWGPLFRLRDWARIRTLEGEALNVRVEPSLAGQVVIRLATGTRVAVIGGPRRAAGYRWWQVRTADGASGWAVESILDARGLQLRTLLPVD